MITQEQFIHYVVGEILDELEYYDCSELFWQKCCAVVRNYHQQYGSFDPNQEGTFGQYQTLFFEALETVRLLANAEREEDEHRAEALRSAVAAGIESGAAIDFEPQQLHEQMDLKNRANE